MKKLLTLMLLPIFLLGIVACGGNEVDKQVEKAAKAINAENYEEAQVLCDQVMQKHWSALTHEQKCDLAICYAALYGELSSNEESNMAALKKCYDAAMKENPQKTRKYLKSVDEDLHDAIKVIIELDDFAKELEADFASDTDDASDIDDSSDIDDF